MGDDAIESAETDWFDFRTPAKELAKQLYKISKSSGVCCGIVGPWGSGKSSFMKLMEEYIKKDSSWKNVHIAWFTAWDPGGIEDLGDAMLYHFFRDIVGKNQEMVATFKELQTALGIRKTFRERARRTLEDVSRTLPGTAKTATAVASSLLKELDAPKKVQVCFEKLVKWLEKEKKTVFFFIDDIDRAGGDQIRDLLSELKLYVSHRGIVAVLGYDENYVRKALKPPVLPSGIDPKKYLEKIVTVTRKVPMSTNVQLGAYAAALLRSLLDSSEHVDRLGSLAASLSSYNPRRLKNLLLAFSQYVSTMKYKPSYDNSATMLIVSAAAVMGYLEDDDIKEAMESGDEDEIVSAILSHVGEDPLKKKEAEILIRAVRQIEPEFTPATLGSSGLSTEFATTLRVRRFGEVQRIGEVRQDRKEFNWAISFIPILSSAAKQGFEPPPATTASSSRIAIPSSTETESLLTACEQQHPRIRHILAGVSDLGCVLNWKEYKMIVLPTSALRGLDPMEISLGAFVSPIFSEIGCLVAEKGFILWLIDDGDLINREAGASLVQRAQELSKGLKHPVIFQYTPSSKVKSLLEFLLRVTTKKS